MSVNPVSEFVINVQLGDSDAAEDYPGFEAALREIVDSNGDSARLAEHRKAVENGRAWLERDTGTEPAAGRRRLFDILALLSEQLLEQVPPEPVDDEMRHLAAVVDKKRHALRVLRALEADPARPADLLERLQLERMQLHRVLNWAVATGLVSRLEVGDQVVYRLTALGQLSLRQRDEPTWLQAAALLAQSSVEARLLDDEPEEHLERREALARRTGLSAEQVERSLAAYARAVDPAASSRLATAILDAAGASRTILFEPPRAEAPASVRGAEGALSIHSERGRRIDLGTSYLFRSFERAGLVDVEIEECSVPAWGSDAPPWSPVVSVSLGAWNPLAERLLDDFGVNVQLRGGDALWHVGDGGPVRFTRERDVDYGFILRLYSDSTGLSHFLLGGLGASGVAAACRSFYHGVERHLNDAPDTSFATVVRVSGDAGEPVRWRALESIGVFDPYGTAWRPVEPAPVLDIAPAARPAAKERGRRAEPVHPHRLELEPVSFQDRAARRRDALREQRRGPRAPYGDALPMAARDQEGARELGDGPGALPHDGYEG